MATRRISQLTLSYPPDWKRQTAYNVPLAGSELTKAFPATSRNYFDIDETIEDVFDCTGEDFLLEILTAQFARLTVDLDFDPDVFAGIVAFAYGVSPSPSAGTDEVQTLTISATGGTFKLVVQVGADAQMTGDIAFDAASAAIQTALEALSNVDTDDIVVTGDGPHVMTFGENFASQDVNLIQVHTFDLTGGSAAIVETTPGVGSEHEISRMTGYTMPVTTLYLGFRGSSEQPFIWKNVAVDTIRVISRTREKVTATVQFVGSADLVQAVGFTTPECQDIIPLRFGDCKMSVGNYDYIENNMGREFEYYYENGIVQMFDGAGVNPTRTERADQRQSGANLFILGEPGDDHYNIFKNKTTLPVFIQCGPGGRMVRFNIPQGLCRLAPTPIRAGGDPPESEIAAVIRPKKVKGQADTPTNVVAVVAQGVAFMLPPA